MQSGLKVVQIGSRGIPGHRGGVEQVVEAVAPRLAARGHDVTVYCASWSSEKASAKFWSSPSFWSASSQTSSW